MKTLYLLRHAKSSWAAPEQKDYDRPLDERGLEEAPEMAARLLARKQIDPEILRDQVTSPNGTTYAGLQRMKAHDFRGLIKETVLAATERSKELSQDS